MKFTLCFFLILISYTNIFSQNSFAANAYYKAIKTEEENIGKEIYFYKNRVSDLNLKILNFQIRKSIAIIDSMPAYNNEVQFKKATIELFKYFLSVSDNQYKDLLKLVENPDIDNKEYKAKLQALFKDISTKEKPYDEKFNAAEDAYTKKYGITEQ